MSTALVYVVDDDEAVRAGLRMLLESAGYTVHTCAGAREFFQQFDPAAPACVILDLNMPETSGRQVQELLARRGPAASIIFLTGHGDVPAAVQALKTGAVDFLQKPLVDEQVFLNLVNDAIRKSTAMLEDSRQRTVERERIACLTPRERQVMDQVCAGKANKVIAAELGISERTVELHRGRVMRKLKVRSLVELVNLYGHPRN